MTPLQKRLREFRQRSNGASAVEFAMLLPLFLLLYLGGVELTDALDANRKLTELTRTIADITAKSDAISATDLKQLAALSSPLMAPHEAKDASVTILAVWTDEKLASTVDWSFSATGAGMAAGGAPAAGSPYALPDTLASKSRQTVVAEVTYMHRPTFGVAITGPLKFSETVYLAPRSGKCVKRSDVGQQSCNR
jgi:Flp pilus assembly protein TadG